MNDSTGAVTLTIEEKKNKSNNQRGSVIGKQVLCKQK